MRFASLLPLVLLVAACGNAPFDDGASARSEDAIVGGNLEPTRYPAMGYLVFKLKTGPHAGEIFRPDCGATLIAPNAIVTAAHCVESKQSDDRDVVGVGFGDAFTGTTYDVVGTWQEWIHPRAFIPRPWGQDGAMVDVFDSRHDVAVIQLARNVEGISPMPIANRPLPAGTPALVIGYGRVEEGHTEESDSLGNRPDHRDRYPGIRKSSDLQIVLAKDLIDAYPLPDTVTRKSGGICYADSGSALILDDGSIAGVLAAWTNEDETSEWIDDTPRCRKDNGGSWTNLQAPDIAAFLGARLHTISTGAVQ